MRRQIFTVALLALSLASASNLPAQDNRNGNTKQPTIEDRIDQLEQNEQNLKSQVDQLRNDVAYLQDRMKRVEEGKQLPQRLCRQRIRGSPAEAPILPSRKRQIPDHSNLMTFFIKACSQVATGSTTQLMEKSGHLMSRVRWRLETLQ
jgi:outer membrane murein-binding lipoprotein Lpp